MQKAIQARRSVKGRGLLNYFLNISPNVIIERHLLASADLIDRTLPWLKYQTTQLDAQTFWLEMTQQLEHLAHECRATWGFRHIDTAITDGNTFIEHSLQKLHKELLHTQQICKTLELNLDVWLQQFESTDL